MFLGFGFISASVAEEPVATAIAPSDVKLLLGQWEGVVYAGRATNGNYKGTVIIGEVGENTVMATVMWDSTTMRDKEIVKVTRVSDEVVSLGFVQKHMTCSL